MYIKNNLFENCKEYWSNEIVKGALRYPEPQVIRFVKKYLCKDAKILDFGCGAGRDSLALSSEGYHMISMDYNQSGLDILKVKNPNIETICNQGIEVPLCMNSVDGVIADGSLFYNSKEDTVQLLKNLHRVIKPYGYMWADWRTKSDSLYGEGEMIGEDYFLLDVGNERKNATYCFYAENELRELYCKAGFKVISVDVGSFTQNNKMKVNEWYYIVAQKV